MCCAGKMVKVHYSRLDTSVNEGLLKGVFTARSGRRFIRWGWELMFMDKNPWNHEHGDATALSVSEDMWLRWHFHVGRNDALPASQRLTTDQITAEEKQEDGGETRCHETKSSWKDVINKRTHLLITKAETHSRCVISNHLDCLMKFPLERRLTLSKAWSFPKWVMMIH